MFDLTVGGPHASFPNLYPYGLCGILNDQILIFTPPGLKGLSLEPNTIFTSDKHFPDTKRMDKANTDDMPTYYIISRLDALRLQRQTDEINPDFFLVPARLHAFDTRFVGFVPASYLLATERDRYFTTLKSALATPVR